MVKFINEVTREFDIKHHILRSWEDKGYLGEVHRDFTHGRMYTEDQIERIKVIQEVVKGQQEKGMSRTDFKEVERVLVDKFGGIVEKRPETIPATPEAFTNMLLKFDKQDKEIQELSHLVNELMKVTKELPVPSDKSEEIERILTELDESRKREEEQKKIIADMNEKLQKSVDFILRMEEKEEKKTFFQRLFG